MAFQNGRLNRELQRQVDIDPLTGLANSRFLRERLAQEVTRARRHRLPLSLVSLEMDEFRAYVLAHGRAAGNDLLVAVGKLIEGAVHAPVDVAARYGADKFVIVLPHATLHGAGQGEAGEAGGPHEGGATGLAERLRDAVEGLARDVGGKALGGRVTISAGVAELGAETPDGDRLLAAADAAQARARGAGGNSVQA